MKDGDTVRIVADTEDSGATGVLRGEAKIAIGARVRLFKIVRFSDGHEGAYEEYELRMVETRP